MNRPTSGLSSCLKAPRNFRVHPQTNNTSVTVSVSSSSKNGSKNAAKSAENWNIVRRTSFSNLSKRFRNKNRIGMDSQSQDYLPTSDDSNNNLNPPLLRSRSTSSCRSRLRDPSIFSSRGTLCESVENNLGEERRSPFPVLKSCLKKSCHDKFLCGADEEGSASTNNLVLGEQFGFRRFLTVTTLIYVCFVMCIPSVLGSKEDFIQVRWQIKHLFKIP